MFSHSCGSNVVIYRADGERGPEHPGGSRRGQGQALLAAQLAKIMGWSGTNVVRELSPCWFEFQATKDTDEHRSTIERGMDKWASDKGVEIDDSCYFAKKLVEDWVALRMNPRGGTA